MNLRLSTLFVALSLALSLAACGGSDEQDDYSAESDFGSLGDEGELEGSGPPAVDSIPDWVPDDFPLPDDFQPVGAKEFFTGMRVLEGRTQMPSDQTFDFFSDALTDQGYDVRTGDNYREQNLVYFDGNGCEDCTIRTTDEGDYRKLQIGL